MKAGIEFISLGSITSPKGFHAGAVYAGLKEKADKSPDLAVLYSEVPCVAAAVFTANRIKAAPVVLSQQRLQDGKASGVVVNSGCANACVGEQGLTSAAEMVGLTAQGLGVSPEDVLVASTGVVGAPLPMERIRAGIGQIVLSPEGGHEFARAIMTTDTVPKEVAVAVGGQFVIGGAAKGSGMICPDMATMLCFLTTDASVEPGFLKLTLRQSVDASFNMIAVDTDTSTNDMVLLMANGLAKGKAITQGSPQANDFQQALNQVCLHLAKAIVRDGEGATKLIEVVVRGAPGLAEARSVARTIVTSPLVKSAIHGSDPNWGRVLAAAGRSGVAVEEGTVELAIGGVPLFGLGRPLPFDEKKVVQILDGSEVFIDLNLNLGDAAATAWGCDLSEEYVTINSQYTT